MQLTIYIQLNNQLA